MTFEELVSVLSSIGMAVGPPLVYADQSISIIRKKDSTGFSRDVCGILLIANITRCFFWIGDRFETALLIQSVLMIIAQLLLLYICMRYRPTLSPENLGTSMRPCAFWQWPTYRQHVEFLAAQIICLGILTMIFSSFPTFTTILGFIALGLESTLPIPQLINNYRRKTLWGFRTSTLAGWLFGDGFKTVYFFVKANPIQFRVCAVFQLAIDFLILFQRIYYGAEPKESLLTTDIDDLEAALRLEAEAEEDEDDEPPTASPIPLTRT